MRMTPLFVYAGGGWWIYAVAEVVYGQSDAICISLLRPLLVYIPFCLLLREEGF